MTRVLVVWEDRYFQTFGPFVKKRVAASVPSTVGPGAFPELLFHTAYGAGGFKRYVSSTWGNARAAGLPGSPGFIDHLICVVDGDKLHEQLGSIPQAPAAPGAVAAWLADAEATWQEHLRGLSDKAPRASVHGLILCWCKESLVLAGYDREAAKRHLGVDVQASEVRAFLAACKPPPVSVPDALFSSTFRKPLRCLADLAKAQPSARPLALGKNAPEFDDALGDLVREDVVVVARRVPDLDRLADLIWQLTTPATLASASGPAPVSVPAPAAAARTKVKRAQRTAEAGAAAKAGAAANTPRGASKPPVGKKRR